MENIKLYERMSNIMTDDKLDIKIKEFINDLVEELEEVETELNNAEERIIELNIEVDNLEDEVLSLTTINKNLEENLKGDNL